MTEDAWNDPTNHFIAYLLRGRTAELPDGDVLVVLNAGPAQADFVMPGVPGQRFTFLVDTRTADGRPAAEVVAPTGSTVVIPADTVLVASGPTLARPFLRRLRRRRRCRTSHPLPSRRSRD